MRSIVVNRLSLAVIGMAALVSAGTQLLHIPVSLPEHHLRLAWGLTRALIQL